LTSPALHKFYEPLVLLEALNIATNEAAVHNTANEPLVLRDLEDIFHAFVYKLAHVCDSDKGGRSVTAIMILRGGSGAVQYYFASNQREQEELDTTKDFIGKLLQQVGETPAKSSNHGPLFDKVLQSVLIFNRPRLTIYWKSLMFQARDCLENCSRLESEDSQ
jgi:hypothetical protein